MIRDFRPGMDARTFWFLIPRLLESVWQDIFSRFCVMIDQGKFFRWDKANGCVCIICPLWLRYFPGQFPGAVSQGSFPGQFTGAVSLGSFPGQFCGQFSGAISWGNIPGQFPKQFPRAISWGFFAGQFWFKLLMSKFSAYLSLTLFKSRSLYQFYCSWLFSLFLTHT